MPGPLDDVRVLEWGILHQGPQATHLLAALGAEVIKIEEPGKGDPTRSNPRILGVPNLTPEGVSRFFEMYNKGKQSITLNLKNEAAREALYRLVAHSDVFLTNFRRSAAKRLCLDYETLARYNSQLIYVSCTAYGSRGPDAELPGIDFAAANWVGISKAMQRDAEEPHIITGLADEMGSVSAAFGILGALYAREKQGVGQEIHTSLLGGGMWVQSTMLGLAFLAGEPVAPFDRTNVDPLYNTYRGSDDKWFCLAGGFSQAASDRYWPRLCQAIGQPELTTDPRCLTAELRIACCHELIPILDGAFAREPRATWMQRLKEEDLPVAPVNSHLDLLTDEQVLANDLIVEYDHPVAGKMKHLGFPVGFTKTPAHVKASAPRLGEHTDHVLREIAGYSAAEVEDLRSQGAL